MSQPSSMFVAGEIKQKLRLIFFWTPCMKKVKRKNEVILQIKILFSDVYTLPSPLAYLLKDIFHANDNFKSFATVNQKQYGF